MEKEIREKTFEENLEELSSIVTQLEAGDVPLDDAISEFQKAMLLAQKCDEKLKTAEEAIKKIVKDNGEIEDFEVED